MRIYQSGGRALLPYLITNLITNLRSTKSNQEAAFPSSDVFQFLQLEWVYKRFNGKWLNSFGQCCCLYLFLHGQIPF